MNLFIKSALFIVLALNGLNGQAEVCPDPNNSSLSWGVPPAPWVKNPYSQSPQGEKDTQFVKADILVTGSLGAGVSCTYYNSAGRYSIWQQIMAQIPTDRGWVGTSYGYSCSIDIAVCLFNTANFS